MNPVEYCNGYSAHNLGLGYNDNPYDPETEVVKYEAWLNGWSAGDNIKRKNERGSE